nr:uncharacterized protein LOC128694796 [Cherax quadricarinatus]
MATSSHMTTSSVARTSRATLDVATSSMATTDIHTSVANDISVSTPAPAGVSTPAPAGVSTPAPAGESTPAPAGVSTPAPAGDSTPAPAGESTPAPAGVSTPAPAGVSTPAPAGESTPAPAGVSTPAPAGESTPAPAGASSAIKRVSLFRKMNPVVSEKKLMIMEYSKIHDILKQIICMQCFSGKMEVTYYEQHLETVACVMCPECGYQLGEKPGSYKILNELTGRMVYGEMLAGRGYCSFIRRNAMCNFPHITQVAYNKYTTMITEKSIESCKEILAESKDIIVQEYAKQNIVPDDNGILDIDVTYDGTWHTRGHHSNIGIGVIIDALTKLVIDYQVLCKFCSMCSFHKSCWNKKIISDAKYEELVEGHKPQCHKNYSGTSAKMESEAAVMMWQRSLENKLRYKTIVSDGDSNTYKAIVDLKDGEGPYPGVKVDKEECINHYVKRLKNRLTNVVQSHYVDKELKTGKKRKQYAMKKKGVLTDFIIEKLAYYFQKNLRENVGTDVASMRNGILASFFHCSSSDEKPQHHLCPTGDDSWCFYQKAIAANLPPPSHTTMKVQFQLEPAYMEEVYNIYQDLTIDKMMQRCLKGRTQNPNESLHQRIWSYCSKALFRTKWQADFSVSHAVAEYNSGYVRSCLDIPLGYGRLALTQRQLESMDKNMQAARTPKYKKRKRGMDTSYEPGGH